VIEVAVTISSCSFFLGRGLSLGWSICQWKTVPRGKSDQRKEGAWPRTGDRTGRDAEGVQKSLVDIIWFSLWWFGCILIVTTSV